MTIISILKAIGETLASVALKGMIVFVIAVLIIIGVIVFILRCK